MNHKKELLRSLWVVRVRVVASAAFSCEEWQCLSLMLLLLAPSPSPPARAQVMLQDRDKGSSQTQGPVSGPF